MIISINWFSVDTFYVQTHARNESHLGKNNNRWIGAQGQLPTEDAYLELF